MAHIGFTGTRKGMTDAQKAKVAAYVGSLAYQRPTVHHGDCVGADAEFHKIVREYRHVEVVLHPPTDDSKRAFCRADEEREPADYLKRDRQIVKESNIIFAAPRQNEEPKSKRAGGTWYTIRHTRKSHKLLVIFWPDGRVTG